MHDNGAAVVIAILVSLATAEFLRSAFEKHAQCSYAVSLHMLQREFAENPPVWLH